MFSVKTLNSEGPSDMTAPRRLVAALLATLTATLVAGTLMTAPTLAAAGDETRFFAGLPYTGEFASPQVLVAKGRYYAVATNEDGNNLPAMHSDDLSTWIPRDPLPDYRKYRDWSGFNDAMPKPGPWAARRFIDGRRRAAVWAPAIAKMGGRFVVAYAAVVNFRTNRLCIGLGYADHPEGKYTSPAKKPIVCSEDTRGSIDPDLIKVGGRNYLIWKNSGVKGSTPTTTWVRRLNAKATGFASGSRAKFLLSTEQDWEGNVTEAPDMVSYDGRFYLFYSGNSYTTRKYATGYAICKTVTGPCRRPTTRPLLSTNKVVVGPGGAAGFKDLDGRLRLAYHAWSRSEVGGSTPRVCSGCPPRRMYVATLEPNANGLLEVTSLR